MTTAEVMQILQEIKDDCSEHIVCHGCKFRMYDGWCALEQIPNKWQLDKVGLEESEDRE